MKEVIHTLLLVILCYPTFAQEVKAHGNLNASNEMVFFNLEKGQIVEAAKANTLEWDIAFQKTTILFNSGTSGPGKTVAQLLDTNFDQLSKAPLNDGYKSDKENGKAIPTGSGNGWYTYDMESHTISPIPNKTILIRTTAGKHYKFEIVSYNRDQKDYEQPGFYSFRFALLDSK